MFLSVDNKIYGAKDKSIFLAFEGTSDFGANIVGKCQQAFNYFSSNRLKSIELIRPTFQVSSFISFEAQLIPDYSDPGKSYLYTYGVPSTVSRWGTAIWGTSRFGSREVTQKSWISVPNSEATSFSFYLTIESKSEKVKFVLTDFLVRSGNFL